MQCRALIAGAIFLTTKSNSLTYTCESSGTWTPSTVQACVGSSLSASLSELLSSKKQYVPPAQEAAGVLSLSISSSTVDSRQ